MSIYLIEYDTIKRFVNNRFNTASPAQSHIVTSGGYGNDINLP